MHTTRVPTAILVAALASAPAMTRADDLPAKLDAAMIAAAEKHKFAGSVIVVKDGRALLSRGYGMANVELGVPNAPTPNSGSARSPSNSRRWPS